MVGGSVEGGEAVVGSSGQGLKVKHSNLQQQQCWIALQTTLKWYHNYHPSCSVSHSVIQLVVLFSKSWVTLKFILAPVFAYICQAIKTAYRNLLPFRGHSLFASASHYKANTRTLLRTHSHRDIATSLAFANQGHSLFGYMGVQLPPGPTATASPSTTIGLPCNPARQAGSQAGRSINKFNSMAGN